MSDIGFIVGFVSVVGYFLLGLLIVKLFSLAPRSEDGGGVVVTACWPLVLLLLLFLKFVNLLEWTRENK